MNYTEKKGTVRRRVFTKTELSASKLKNKPYELKNNFFSKQNTFGTIESDQKSRENSQGSLYKY